MFEYDMKLDHSYLVDVCHSTDTMQDVSQGSDIALFIVVELAVTCTILEVFFQCLGAFGLHARDCSHPRR